MILSPCAFILSRYPIDMFLGCFHDIRYLLLDEVKIHDRSKYFSLLLPVFMLIENQWILEENVETYFIGCVFVEEMLFIRGEESLKHSGGEKNQCDNVVCICYHYVVWGPVILLLVKCIFMFLLTVAVNWRQRYFERLKGEGNDFIAQCLQNVNVPVEFVSGSQVVEKEYSSSCYNQSKDYQSYHYAQPHDI